MEAFIVLVIIVGTGTIVYLIYKGISALVGKEMKHNRLVKKFNDELDDILDKILKRE